MGCKQSKSNGILFGNRSQKKNGIDRKSAKALQRERLLSDCRICCKCSDRVGIDLVEIGNDDGSVDLLPIESPSSVRKKNVSSFGRRKHSCYEKLEDSDENEGASNEQTNFGTASAVNNFMNVMSGRKQGSLFETCGLNCDAEHQANFFENLFAGIYFFPFFSPGQSSSDKKTRDEGRNMKRNRKRRSRNETHISSPILRKRQRTCYESPLLPFLFSLNSPFFRGGYNPQTNDSDDDFSSLDPFPWKVCNMGSDERNKKGSIRRRNTNEAIHQLCNRNGAERLRNKSAIGITGEQAMYPSVHRMIGYSVTRVTKLMTNNEHACMYSSTRRLIGYPIEAVMYESVQRAIGYPVEAAMYESAQHMIGYQAPSCDPEAPIGLHTVTSNLLYSTQQEQQVDSGRDFVTNDSYGIQDKTHREEELEDTVLFFVSPPLKKDPEYKKYFKMLKMGLPIGAVKNAVQRDGKDPDIMDLDPEKSLKSQIKTENKYDEDDGPPLKEDPEYKKYFKMRKMGLPIGAVQNAVQRDGKDPAIMDLDPEKSLKSQIKTEDRYDEDDGPPLKEDPEYEKYFKMLKMGLPVGAVKNAIQRDGKDPDVMDLDSEKSLKSQMNTGDKDEEYDSDESDEDDGLPLKEDPEYKNAVQRDGKDPDIMDLDPEKSLKSQIKTEDKYDEDDGPPLKEDPEYKKYFKMLKMGLPVGAVKNAVQRDGKNPAIMDLDPEKSLKSQIKTEDRYDEDDGPPLKEDPEYEKYFKMRKMGLPVGAVKNAVQRDGKDPDVMDLDPEKSLKSQIKTEDRYDEDDGPPLKEDPEYEKYFKMLKMGLPVGAVKNAVQRDGKDPNVMDLDSEKSLKSQIKTEDKDDGPPVKEDPEYEKYFKMLKMGLPVGAVKNAIQRDDLNPAVIDLDPEKSLATQLEKGRNSTKITKPKKKKSKQREKKRVRRKKIYWTPIDPGKIHKESIWSIVKGKFVMDLLKYDVKEFESLFTESSEPNAEKKSKNTSGEGAASRKKKVQIIDGKRDMNGGIILARLKIEYSRLAKMVDQMESGTLDANQLRALKEFLPSDEERAALSEVTKVNKAAIEDLSECEKYMASMMVVSKAGAKFDCMLFRNQFQSRLDDLMNAVKVVRSACDDVRSSEKLRQVMAMILTVVNHINTGGEGKSAVGFSLDALLKLNEAKAFDKKTSVLHYLVKVVKANDETLLRFKEDILSIAFVGGIQLDTLSGDLKALHGELGHIQQIAKDEADRLCSNNKLSLSKQHNKVIEMGSISQDNKVEVVNTRTPMETFAAQAASAVQKATHTLDNTKQIYSKLLEYFGEEETMSCSDFFGTMNKFALEFEITVQREEMQEKEKKEKLRAATKKASAAKKLSGTHGQSKPETKGMKSISGEPKGIAGKKDTQTIVLISTGTTAINTLTTPVDETTIDPQEHSTKKLVSPTSVISNLASTITMEDLKVSLPVPTILFAEKGSTTCTDNTSAYSSISGFATCQEAPFTEEGIAVVAEAEGFGEEEAGVHTSISDPPLTGAGDIAAIAAARSRQTNHQDRTPHASRCFKPVTSVLTVGLSGIVGAAIDARAANSRKKEDADTIPTLATAIELGSIAAAAAARSRKEGVDENAPMCNPILSRGGGIAAMAAAAAGCKLSKYNDMTSPASPYPPLATLTPAIELNGFAVAAAAAAAAACTRQRKIDENSSIPNTRLPGGGGIAAMAAAATRSRVSKDGDTISPVSSFSKITTSAPDIGLGGIAAAAHSEKREIAGEASKPTDTFRRGGIAVITAAAARSRRRIQEQNDHHT